MPRLTYTGGAVDAGVLNVVAARLALSVDAGAEWTPLWEAAAAMLGGCIGARPPALSRPAVALAELEPAYLAAMQALEPPLHTVRAARALCQYNHRAAVCAPDHGSRGAARGRAAGAPGRAGQHRSAAAPAVSTSVHVCWIDGASGAFRPATKRMAAAVAPGPRIASPQSR